MMGEGESKPRRLLPGDPAPWFVAPTEHNPNFHFHTVGGRYLVLAFLGSAGRDPGRAALAGLLGHRNMFDDRQASLFVVLTDPDDEAAGRLKTVAPGIRCFRDFDRAISRLYGAAGEDGTAYRPMVFVIDPGLRVLAVFAIAEPERVGDKVAAFLAGLPALPAPVPAAFQAPILIVPNVFEPAFCERLVELYEAEGGADSGFMRERDGRTVAVIDYSHKRRFDHVMRDSPLREQARARIHRRVAPEVKKAFQFDVTRMERYIVACYDASTGGYFNAHRDNTTRGTAHRRFAVTLNLNAGEYEGGELRFPEFGTRTYVPPSGAALVFSCSLLHEVLPIRAGRRFAFLPFLYDDAAARIREENNAYLGDDVEKYRDKT
jgi:predicted 2-oxoglutarate/Fe(II)-dependent dioxygenase YbiX/peroxiredoxin